MQDDPLKSALQALAAPAEVQLARYPAFAVAADELALEFDAAVTAWEHRRVAVNGEQQAGLLPLDAFLGQFSGPEHAALWTAEALRTETVWAEVREAAAHVLALFGWPSDPPGPNAAAYVRSAAP